MHNKTKISIKFGNQVNLIGTAPDKLSGPDGLCGRNEDTSMSGLDERKGESQLHGRIARTRRVKHNAARKRHANSTALVARAK